MGCSQSSPVEEPKATPKENTIDSQPAKKKVVVKKVGAASKAKPEAAANVEAPAAAETPSMPFLVGKDTVPEEKHGKLAPEARSVTAKDKKKNILENLEGVIRLGDQDYDVFGGFVLTQQRLMSYAYGVKHLDIKFTDGRVHKMLFLWEANHLGEDKVFIIQLPANIIDKSLDGEAQIRWNTDRAEELCGIVTTLHAPEPEPEDRWERLHKNPDVKLYRETPPK